MPKEKQKQKLQCIWKINNKPTPHTQKKKCSAICHEIKREYINDEKSKKKSETNVDGL